MPSQLSPENLNTIRFPRACEVSNFPPINLCWSSATFSPRKTRFLACKLRSTISAPIARFHCLRNHSTSASSGIVEISRGDRCVPLAPCARLIGGESNHRGQRLRRFDGRDLRRAREPKSPRFGRSPAGGPALYHDAG